MPYILELKTVFSAAHAIVISGWREPLHGHDWHVTVSVEANSLDADGLVVDFHAVGDQLKAITGPFHNRSLNETPPFNTVNPTAELVAQHIGTELARWLQGTAAAKDRGLRLKQVHITEAVGCAAVFVP